jgi:hypothetical protein
MANPPELDTLDTSGFTEADWAELRKLRDAWENGGPGALFAAQKSLRQADPICWFRLVRTFYPQLLRKMVGDEADRAGN